MNLFEFDWQELFDALPAWHALDESAKRTMLSNLRPNTHIDPRGLGDRVRVLKEHGFIRDMESSRWVEVSPKMHKIVVALRAMDRNSRWTSPGYFEQYTLQVLDKFELMFLEDYCPRSNARSFAPADFAVTTQWLTDFLTNKGKRERPCGEDGYFFHEPMDTLPTVLGIAKRLLRLLMDSPQAMPLSALPGCVGTHERKLVASAIRAGVRRLLFYPHLRAHDLEPMMGLWPPVSERLHRPPTTAAEPLPTAPLEQFCLPFWVEDVVTIATASASVPLKRRQLDLAIFSKRKRELSEELVRLPDWIEQVLHLHPRSLTERAEDMEYPRLDYAVAVLNDFGWLVNSRSLLSLNKNGMNWLAKSPDKRLKEILDGFLTGRRPDKRIYHTPITKILANEYRLMESPNRYDGKDYYPLAEFARAFGALPVGTFRSCNRFIEHESRLNNPLLNATRKWHIRRGFSDILPTEEKLEQVWKELLQGFLLGRLVPLGGAALGHNGRADGGEVYFALTDIGRYLLSLADHFEYAHAPSGEVVVQPNFEIVFLGPNPIVEATCGRFSERASKSRHVGTLFRITKRSCIAAAAAGMTVETAMETLTQASRKPIPENVAHEIKSWFGQCRTVTLRSAMLIECPDADTATQVETLGVRGLKRLNDVTLEVLNAAGHDARKSLEKRLRERGIFLRPNGNEKDAYDL
jgi:hypothetical protein